MSIWTVSWYIMGGNRNKVNISGPMFGRLNWVEMVETIPAEIRATAEGIRKRLAVRLMTVTIMSMLKTSSNVP